MHSLSYTILAIIILAIVVASIFIAKLLGIELITFKASGISKAPRAKTQDPEYEKLKIQACERFMLLADRLDLNNLVLRLPCCRKTALEYRLELLNTISTEYNHNVPSQLYLNDELCLSLKNLINQLRLAINVAFQNLPSDASASDFVKAILGQNLKANSNLIFNFQSNLRKYIRSQTL